MKRFVFVLLLSLSVLFACSPISHLPMAFKMAATTSPDLLPPTKDAQLFFQSHHGVIWHSLSQQRLTIQGVDGDQIQVELIGERPQTLRYMTPEQRKVTLTFDEQGLPHQVMFSAQERIEFEDFDTLYDIMSYRHFSEQFPRGQLKTLALPAEYKIHIKSQAFRLQGLPDWLSNAIELVGLGVDAAGCATLSGASVATAGLATVGAAIQCGSAAATLADFIHPSTETKAAEIGTSAVECAYAWPKIASSTSLGKGVVNALSLLACGDTLWSSAELKNQEQQARAELAAEVAKAQSELDRAEAEVLIQQALEIRRQRQPASQQTSLKPGSSTQPVTVPLNLEIRPALAPKGAVLLQHGSGFSPNAQVEIFANYPGDRHFVSVANLQADSSGRFLHLYNSASASRMGRYKLYARDLKTGQSTTVQSFVLIQPTVSVLPEVAQRGQAIQQNGTGFTPDSTVSLYFQGPDGQVSAKISKTTDSQGQYAHSYQPHTQTLTGVHSYWAVDDASGRSSARVRFEVLPAELKINVSASVYVRAWGPLLAETKLATTSYLVQRLRYPALALALKNKGGRQIELQVNGSQQIEAVLGNYKGHGTLFLKPFQNAVLLQNGSPLLYLEAVSGATVQERSTLGLFDL